MLERFKLLEDIRESPVSRLELFSRFSNCSRLKQKEDNKMNMNGMQNTDSKTYPN